MIENRADVFVSFFVMVIAFIVSKCGGRTVQEKQGA